MKILKLRKFSFFSAKNIIERLSPQYFKEFPNKNLSFFTALQVFFMATLMNYFLPRTKDDKNW